MLNPFGKGGKVRYGVVAGGQISQEAFMPGVGQTSNSTMTALVTGDPVKADKLASKYGLKAYSYEQFGALLASGEIDAVYVATPNFLHRQFAEPALEAGIHVLLEKPMATSEEDCSAIIAAQRKTGAKLMIAYRMHFEPTTVEIMQRVHKGDFGDPRGFISAFTQTVSEQNHRAKHGYWGGPVPDVGTYPLNAARNLFRAEPIEVHAVGSKTAGFAFNFLDTVAVTLLFPDQRMAQFLVSYAMAPGESFSLIGRKGSLIADPCFTFGPQVGISYTTAIGGKNDVRKGKPVDQFGGETAYFSDCILNDRDPEPDGEEGLLDVRVLAAVERALETGKPQHLDPVTRAKSIAPAQAHSLAHSKTPALINVVAQDG